MKAQLKKLLKQKPLLGLLAIGIAVAVFYFTDGEVDFRDDVPSVEEVTEAAEGTAEGTGESE